MSKITIEKHDGIHVLRDDLLPGGTKSILMPYMITNDHDEFVYASPVYGGFQIALAHYCKSIGKKAVIFCAKRRNRHENTNVCASLGSKIIEVDHGYLSVVEKAAQDYCDKHGAKKLEFGGNTEENKSLIAYRMNDVSSELGFEPDFIWCAIGSGTLVEGILLGTKTAKVNGVQVGMEYDGEHPRMSVYTYPKPFEAASDTACPFPSMPNYDLKAWEYCKRIGAVLNKGSNILFWNVL